MACGNMIATNLFISACLLLFHTPEIVSSLSILGRDSRVGEPVVNYKQPVGNFWDLYSVFKSQYEPYGPDGKRNVPRTSLQAVGRLETNGHEQRLLTRQPLEQLRCSIYLCSIYLHKQ